MTTSSWSHDASVDAVHLDRMPSSRKGDIVELADAE